MGEDLVDLTLCLFETISTSIVILLGTVHWFLDLGSIALLFKTKLN